MVKLLIFINIISFPSNIKKLVFALQIYSDSNELNHIKLAVVMLITITFCFVVIFIGFLRVRKRLSSQLPFQSTHASKFKCKWKSFWNWIQQIFTIFILYVLYLSFQWNNLNTSLQWYNTMILVHNFIEILFICLNLICYVQLKLVFIIEDWCGHRPIQSNVQLKLTHVQLCCNKNY